MAMRDNNRNDALSINRFKDVDLSTLPDNEYQDYVLAKLMQDVIQRLEGSIQNDRIYNRTKFDVMKAFWAARDELRRESE